MSFADFAGSGSGSARMGSAPALSSGMSSSSKSKQAVDAATLKLEQFQRQVLAIKRAAANATPTTASLTRKNSTSAMDDDLHDRIRFACLLQEEIAKALTMIPSDPANSLLKRKLCKDFEVISTQLEQAVHKISAQEQLLQESLVQQQKDSHSGNIVVEHQGQVLEFAELEQEIAHNEALIEEREKDIDKIHQSVAQVNEIFRDLAMIVQEQQSSIDDIENHVHESLAQTQHGLDEVRKASEMQRSCAIQ